MEPARDERSVRDLLTELLGELTLLVRKEVELARAETSEKLSQLGSGLLALAAGMLFAFAGLLILLDALVLELSDGPGLDPALSALIVGGVVAVLGIALLLIGRGNLRARALAPRRMAESLRRDREMIDERLR